MDSYYDDPSRVCIRCKEDWPDDEEFYRPGHKKCIACEYETKNSAPSRQPAARKTNETKRR